MNAFHERWNASRYVRKTMSLSDELTKLTELQKLADAIPTERGRELGRKICAAIKENAESAQKTTRII